MTAVPSPPLMLIIVWIMVSISCAFQLSTTTTKKSRSFALAMTSPNQLIAQGMQAFREGDIPGSIKIFDQAENMDPSLTPYLWQRGISYYYNEDFQRGSDQFRIDVNVNPLDVEEIVWDIACLNQMNSKEAYMSLPKGKKDRRKIMAIVYALFRGDAKEQDLALAGHGGSSAADEFYAAFYLGLFCESKGETTKAANYLMEAVRTKYANDFGRGDYMTAVARVHCRLRGWA